MADRRRRHSTECESETEHAEPQLSEYESTADESRDVEETEEDTDDEEYVTEEEDTAEEEEDGDKKGVADGERQSGDGEEQPKLDIDEDRQNPAYIPKRGAFYEHDMRLDPDEEVPGEQKEERRAKGKLWKDESKWMHDKFDHYAQAPKSRQELITMYGYDITQGDQPPEQPPKSSARPRGGRREYKAQFQDFLPGDKGRQSYDGNKERYEEDSYDDRGPWKSTSDTTQYRGGRGRGRGGSRRSEGGGQRRGYSDFKENQGQRNRTYSDQGRELKGQDTGDYKNRDFYGNREKETYNNREGFGNRENRENVGRRDRDNYGNRDRENYRNRENNSNRENYGNRDKENYGNRDRENYGNRDRENYGNRDRENYGNRDRENYNRKDRDSYGENSDSRGNYGNKSLHEESSYGRGSKDFQERPEGRGGFRGRGRGGFRDNRRENRPDNADQQSSGRSNRENTNYERQYSGGRDGRNYERQYSGGRDTESQYRRQGENRTPRNEPDSPQEQSRYRGSDVHDRVMARSFDKPTPKSYYTLSVTDDEKLGEIEEGDHVAGGVQDMNVTVTGDRRSFKDRPRPPRSQDYVQQSSLEERRDTGSLHGTSGPSKHQPTLPPRLQQQQQQQERKRQKQQQQAVVEKQDSAQSRSAKRYSSQRQRTVPETQIAQPPEQIVAAPLQQQFQPNFSPPKPAGIVQPSGIVRPTIATQINAPPQQPVVGSPTLVIPRVPPPQTLVPVASQVPPPQFRPQRPPPPTGPAPQGLGAPPPVFPTGTLPTGTLPTSGMPAVSVIANPLMNPTGLVYAAPPPAYQVPVPQFSATPQDPHPGETVRGGTTYYPQATPGSAPSTGTTYYSPAMQIGKQNRLEIRRPKVPLPIVNPEDMKGDTGAETSKDMDEESEEGYQGDSNESMENAVTQEQVDLDTTTSDIGNLESIVDISLEQAEESYESVLEDDVSMKVSETETAHLTYENTDKEVSEPNFKPEEQTNSNTENSISEQLKDFQSNDVEETQGESVNVEEEKNDSVEQCKEPTDISEVEITDTNTQDDNRSSTFVVKTDVLSPTLSVSTVMPEAINQDSTENDQNKDERTVENVTAGDSAIDISENQDKNISYDETNDSEKSNKEIDDSCESFEDAVEEVS